MVRATAESDFRSYRACSMPKPSLWAMLLSPYDYRVSASPFDQLTDPVQPPKELSRYHS